MAYRTCEEKEAYKAGIKKGKQMVSYTDYGGHSTDEETQTERLIKAINDLTAEVKKATELRNKVHAEKPAKTAAPRRPAPMPDTYIKEAIKDLQAAIGTPITGQFAMVDVAVLKARKVTADDIKIWQ